MSRDSIAALLCLVVGLYVAGQVTASERVVSGLQPGEKITAIFEPLNITGPFANERHCLVCENGVNPVAMLFAKEISDPLVELLVKLDGATDANKSHEMGSFLVLLNSQEDQIQRLRDIARRRGLKHIVLSADEPAGPDGFKVSAAAELTVVLYHEFEVKANHAFRKGELTVEAIQGILADVPKIVPRKQN
jgi:hypothetical protein